MRGTHPLAGMAVCMLLGGSVVIAEPQRGGGDGGGGERHAVPRTEAAPAPAAPRPNGGGAVVAGGSPVVYHGGPHYATRDSYVFVGGYFYDPFYGPYPWWPASAYGWGYAPVFDYHANVRIQGPPKDAAVYVDGFYAGVVDDFDGTFQRLPLTPGGHRIEIFKDGFHTVRKDLYLQPGGTVKMRETLEPLAAGEKSEAPEIAPPVPPPPDGTYNAPNGRPPRSAAPAGVGTLAVQVQPREAEVSVDGQRWLRSGAGEFEVRLPAGRHRVEVELQGFERFSREIDVRAEGTTPLNVSLTRTSTN